MAPRSAVSASSCASTRSSSTARYNNAAAPNANTKARTAGPDAAQDCGGGDGADRGAHTEGGANKCGSASGEAPVVQFGGQREGQEEDLEGECDGQDECLGGSELRAETDKHAIDEQVDRRCHQEPYWDGGCDAIACGGSGCGFLLAVEATSVGGEGEYEYDAGGEAGGDPAQIALVS